MKYMKDINFGVAYEVYEYCKWVKLELFVIIYKVSPIHFPQTSL